jgi:MarR family transcriptional regulator, organic hydroperoxide resistance regulator
MSLPALRPRPPAPISTAVSEVGRIVAGLRRVVRALELYSQEVRRDFGLTAPQLWALKTLERTGPLTTGALAKALVIHQSSASLLAGRLERRGLVRRTRSPDDRRCVRIELTDQGHAICAEAPEPAQGRLLHGLATMSPPRIRNIRRAVEDLVRAMEAESVDARFFFAEATHD